MSVKIENLKNDIKTNFIDLCYLNKTNKNNHIYDIFLYIKQIFLLDNNCCIFVKFILCNIYHLIYY